MRVGSAGCGASVRSAHKQVGLLLVAAGPLRTEFGQLALNVLLTDPRRIASSRADATEK